MPRKPYQRYTQEFKLEAVRLADESDKPMTEVARELGVSYTTVYSYDAADRVLTVIYPGGRPVTYSRDALGRIVGINTPVNGTAQAIITNATYRADGLVTGWTYGNGLPERRVYDLQGRLIEQDLPNAPPLTPVTGVALAPNLPSPQTAGTAVTFTAQASGGGGSPEYRFLLQGPATNNVQQEVRAYAPQSTWTWASTAADIGVSTIVVQARNVGSTNAFEATSSLAYSIAAAAPPPVNTPPTANAGADQTVTVGTAVTLDGTDSSDPDGTITAYAWTQTAGPTVTLTGAATATAGFTAPTVTVDTVFTFQLTVTDDAGATGSDTANITVTGGGGGTPALQNGVPVVGLSGAAAAELHFTFEVPTGASDLRVELSGGSGNADLYVRFGAPASLIDHDCASATPGNDEVCTFGEALAGTTYVLIHSETETGFADVTLIASYTEAAAAEPTTVIITRAQPGAPSDRIYWLKGGATQPQWLAVTDPSPYLSQPPVQVLDARHPTVVRWERNEHNGGYTRTALTDGPKAILAALSTNVAPATVAARTYAYDANGNLLSHSELTNGLHRFAYDALDRLASDTEPSLPGRSFLYDPNGKGSTTGRGQILSGCCPKGLT